MGFVEVAEQSGMVGRRWWKSSMQNQNKPYEYPEYYGTREIL